MKEESLDPAWIGEGAEDHIYRENILDHYKHPHNFGKLPSPTVTYREVNPMCGDAIELSLAVTKNKVDAAAFTGAGCAISIATISMLTDQLKGKTLAEVQKMDKETVMKLLGIHLGPVRMKCGLLCLRAVLGAVTQLEKHHEKT